MAHNSDERLNEEIEFHIEQQTAKNIRAGMTREAAASAARKQFGNVDATKDYARDELKFAVLRDFTRDLRLGARRLRRSPGFALAAILTFGLGIGAATSMFSIVNAVLLQPLPYPQADRIVRLRQVGKSGPMGNVSHPNFIDWKEGTHSFAAMAEMNAGGRETVSFSGGEPMLAHISRVEKAFFDVMRVQPAQGRMFAGDELNVAGSPAVLVSAAFWRKMRGDKPFTSGETLTYGPDVYAVIGVMPEGFSYPAGAEAWTAIDRRNRANESRTSGNFTAIARLADGVTLDRAHADISTVSRAVSARTPNDNYMLDGTATPLLELLTERSRPSLLMLFGASVLLLIVACTNVSNLLLVRAAARRGEFAVQLAIGASRARLIRQNLAETLVLCLSGGVLGVVIAIGVVRVVAASGVASAPRLDTLTVNWPVLVFALAASALSAMALSFITAASDRQGKLTSILSTAQRGNSGSRRDLRGREILIVTQTALTVILLAGATLLGASFMKVLAVDPGFDLSDAVLIDFTWPFPQDEQDGVHQASAQEEIMAEIRRLPGVRSAGLTGGFPLGGGSFSNGHFVEMTRADEFAKYAEIRARGPEWYKANSAEAELRIVGQGYFETMRIPLLRGRMFQDSDVTGGRQVAVISKSLAELRWKGRDPIGRFIQFGNMDGDYHGLEVVGIVGDVREMSPEAPVDATVYALNRQRPRKATEGAIVIRGSADSASTIAAARAIIRRVDPRVPVEARTMVSAYEKVVGSRRFTFGIVAAFGAAALLLSAIGVYGLISYSVEQRTRELGIRIALGATPSGITNLIVGRGAALSLIGCVVGLVGAVALGGVVSGMLYGTSSTDPLVLGTVALTMIAVTAVASLIPVRRALAKSPVTSLRSV